MDFFDNPIEFRLISFNNSGAPNGPAKNSVNEMFGYPNSSTLSKKLVLKQFTKKSEEKPTNVVLQPTSNKREQKIRFSESIMIIPSEYEP